jgi:hypothetical protein
LIKRGDQSVQRLAIFHIAAEGASIRPGQVVIEDSIAVQIGEVDLRRSAIGAR